jgi:CRP/FNR family transcriptional regulator/CRP/FNR family cyclic AMP-dependent transcriptional regulator
MAPGPLQHLRLFSGLPSDKVAILEAAAARRSFRRGEVVFHKGDPGTTMFVIIEGQVKIVLTSESGEEAVLGVLDVGDFFGELSLIDGQPRSATITATDPTDTLVLHREALLDVIKGSPEVAIGMLRILAQRLRETDEMVQDAVFLDVPARLAKKLLELADSYGTETQEGIYIRQRITQQELATMVGATRESVNKHLRSYRARGIIDVDHQHVVIVKRAELQRRIY